MLTKHQDNLELLSYGAGSSTVARRPSRSCRLALRARYDDSLADLTRAIELDEKYAWAIANRGEAYRLIE